MKQHSLSLQQITQIALMAAVICILAPFKIPLIFTPIPLTLGVFAVLLCAYLFPPFFALFAVFIYLCLGLVGLPVFTGFQSGFSVLVGPTGGYLIGYLPLVWISSYFIQHNPKEWIKFLGMFLGLILLYALGTIWFSISKSMSITQAVFLTALPFIPFDILKIILAYLVGKSVRERLRLPVIS